MIETMINIVIQDGLTNLGYVTKPLGVMRDSSSHGVVPLWSSKTVEH